MTALYIAKALNGRRSGSGWMARCPAHRDANPSLSIRDSDGKILIHCFAGCSQDDVVSALRQRGLWPEKARHQWTRAERREYARRRSRAETLAERALRWRTALVRQLQQAKAAAYAQYLAHPDEHSEQAWADTAQQLFSYEELCGAALAQRYHEAMTRDPVAVDRLIAEARDDEAHAQRCTAFILAAMVLKVGAE